jgi:hypothetical protein
LLSRVFPYAIYYSIDDQRAVVWAVVDSVAAAGSVAVVVARAGEIPWRK